MGAASSEFRQKIEDLVIEHRPKLLYLLETRLSGHRVEENRNLLSYDGVHTIESIGLSGGI